MSLPEIWASGAPSPADTALLAPHGYSRRSYLFSIATIVCFAAGFLQFALLDRWAPPAAERVNNGQHATFFAVHTNPYYLFSEDFHLYTVRAKRILDRGWTDSLLTSRPDAGRNYTAPLQAGLGMLAVATDGRPLPFAIYMSLLLGAGWMTMFLAARRWMPPTVSTRSLLAAVLVASLFESIGGVLNSKLDFVQWPVHRGLRLSTLGWSSPLVVAATLAATSLWFDATRRRSTALWLVVLLCVLAAADNWAFVLSFAVAGLVLLGIVGAAAVEWRWSRTVSRSKLTGAATACAALCAGAVLHTVLSGGLSGDALTRGGIGPVWRAGEGPQDPAFFRDVWRYFWLLPAIIGVTAVTVRFGRSEKTGEWWWTRCTLRTPAKDRLAIIALGAVPAVAMLLAFLPLFFAIGMEPYHAYQFIWRTEFALLFAVTLLAAEAAKALLRQLSAGPRSARRWEIVATCIFVLALGGYHLHRIHRFASVTAAREFFLTADEEHLRDWLATLPPEKVRSLATASHELNLLCAYWTNADLLLPEGFPYHNAASSREIEQHMAELLALYRVQPQDWEAFNLHGHADDQWSWHNSRLLSAREGYSYYLMHRAISADGYNNPYDVRTHYQWPKSTVWIG